MATDLRTEFHSDLDHVKADVVRLASMVGEAIQRGTEALLANDLGAAQELIDYDDELDALSIDIEDRSYRLLALQSPMATDLRHLVATLKINAEVERSGDLVTNIMKGARRMYGVTFSPKVRGSIATMSTEAAKLMRLAVDAYADTNGTLGTALDDIDDTLDAEHADYIQYVFESHADGDIDIQQAVQLSLIGRYYERIGDHAVNIGQRVRFMADGHLPEHAGAARARAAAQLAIEEAEEPDTT